MGVPFHPPGFLRDFDQIPGQLGQWSAAISGWIDENIEIAAAKQGSQAVPFYNASTSSVPGPYLDQPIVWNGFPGTLRNRWPRPQALDLADQLFPLTQRMDGPGRYFVGEIWNRHFYRPQDEYCEWRLTRDDDGRIIRVTFTSEPPEYWQAMHGDELANMQGVPTYPFTGDKSLLLDLYRELVGPEVQLADLECAEDMVDHSDPSNPVVVYPKGSYNPYNHWNTVGGIVHLTHPANSLSAEINLAALATVLYTQDGRPVVAPDDLICVAAYGGLNRASDPTIGSSVNELAALGAPVTLRDPIGLAMHHLDLAGFEAPNGEPVDGSFFTVVRGDAADFLMERAVFEVPASEGFTVSDITIGGVPITHGGQIAERMAVNIVGRASQLGTLPLTRTPGTSAGCQDDLQPSYLFYRGPGQRCAPYAREAFAYPPATPAAAEVAGAAVAAQAAAAVSTPHPLQSAARRR